MKIIATVKDGKYDIMLEKMVPEIFVIENAELNYNSCEAYFDTHFIVKDLEAEIEYYFPRNRTILQKEYENH